MRLEEYCYIRFGLSAVPNFKVWVCLSVDSQIGKAEERETHLQGQSVAQNQ
jgi:hypothetical protein